MLNSAGFTDWQGNKLKVDGTWGEKTDGAFKKYMLASEVDENVAKLQNELNNNNYRDKNGNYLKVDGKLGPKTDFAVHTMINEYEKSLEKQNNLVHLDNNIPNPDAFFPENPGKDYKIETAKLSAPQWIAPFGSTSSAKDLILDVDYLIKNAQQYKHNNDGSLNKDAIPETPKTYTEEQNASRALNDYFWRQKYGTVQIKNVQKLLNTQNGTSLAIDGDIGVNTAGAICAYANKYNMTLKQASDRIVEVAKAYNDISQLNMSKNNISNIQRYLDMLGYTGDAGHALKNKNGNYDGIIGIDTTTALVNYSKFFSTTPYEFSKKFCDTSSSGYVDKFNNTYISNANISFVEKATKNIADKFTAIFEGETPVVNFTFNCGTGLYANVEVYGVTAEIGGKLYYSLCDTASGINKQGLELSAMIKATDNIELGGSVTGTVEAGTRKFLESKGFAGIKIGNTVFGFDNLPKNKDFTLELSAGAYLVVGADISLDINISEFLRRIFD